MTLEQAQTRLSKAQERLRQWYVQNTDAVPPEDLMKPVRELAAWIDQHKEATHDIQSA